MSSNTGIAATRPNSLSQMFLSRQLVSVGNNVDRNTWGAGRSCEGHHLGVRATSYTPKRLSLWKADSGDALGEGRRRLGARDELCAALVFTGAQGRWDILPTSAPHVRKSRVHSD